MGSYLLSLVRILYPLDISARYRLRACAEEVVLTSSTELPYVRPLVFVYLKLLYNVLADIIIALWRNWHH